MGSCGSGARGILAEEADRLGLVKSSLLQGMLITTQILSEKEDTKTSREKSKSEEYCLHIFATGASEITGITL